LPVESNTENLHFSSVHKDSEIFCFFFPAFPRNFKNFEIIGKAAEILNKKGISAFEVVLTIDGTENEYAENIVRRYNHIENLKFIGLQTKTAVEKYYNKADALIFPSKLESWGLPISEFEKYNKPMLVSNLPYAYETVGDYDKVKYFNPDDEFELAEDMSNLMSGKISFTNKGKIVYEDPVCFSWEELFQYLIK
jgi:glycosyltransferase involved in cell wall biosynthesis